MVPVFVLSYLQILPTSSLKRALFRERFRLAVPLATFLVVATVSPWAHAEGRHRADRVRQNGIESRAGTMQ
jgi:hypothetical protein